MRCHVMMRCQLLALSHPISIKIVAPQKRLDPHRGANAVKISDIMMNVSRCWKIVASFAQFVFLVRATFIAGPEWTVTIYSNMLKKRGRFRGSLMTAWWISLTFVLDKHFRSTLWLKMDEWFTALIRLKSPRDLYPFFCGENFLRRSSFLELKAFRWLT